MASRLRSPINRPASSTSNDLNRISPSTLASTSHQTRATSCHSMAMPMVMKKSPISTSRNGLMSTSS
ncbi:hypothetical protein D3C84_165040 [compost metagenome]